MGILLGCAVLAACGDGSSMTGPETLLPTERSVVEQIAVDRIMDLVWVVDGSHGGTFPHLAFAFRLPGGAGFMGSVTVDPSHEPGLFDPYCTPSVLEGLSDCLRIRKHAQGGYELRVYYTIPPDRTARERPELTYAGQEPAGTIRYRPQPIRIWAFETDDGGSPGSVTSAVSERFGFTPAEGGPSLELAVEGDLEGVLGDVREVRAELSVGGLAACERLRIEFEGLEHESFGGEIRCAGRVWADLVFAPGTALQVVWLD